MLKFILATVLADKISKNEKVKKGIDAGIKGVVKGAKAVKKKVEEIYEENQENIDGVTKTMQEQASKVGDKVTEMVKNAKGEDVESDTPPEVPKNEDFGDVIDAEATEENETDK